MSENQKCGLERLARSVDVLDELESEKLVSFSEGMAFVKNNTCKADAAGQTSEK